MDSRTPLSRLRRGAVGLLFCLVLLGSVLAAGCRGRSLAPLSFWSSMSWAERWCHATYVLRGDPAQFGDGRCESLL